MAAPGTRIDAQGNVVIPERYEMASPSTRILISGGQRAPENRGCVAAVCKGVKGISPIFWLLLLSFVTFCVLASFYDSTGFLIGIVLTGWFISLTLHEFGHAYVAYKGGDTSVVDSGYLTMDVTKYVDPLMSVAVPMLLLPFGVALPGAAVQLQVSSFRHIRWETFVALAGPLANFLMAILVSGVAGLGTAIMASMDRELPAALAQGLAVLSFYQVFAALINLLPLPPLDGWNAVSPWLSDSCFMKRWVGNPWHKKSLQIVTFLVIFVGVQFIPGFTLLLRKLSSLVGIDSLALYVGGPRFQRAFRLNF